VCELEQRLVAVLDGDPTWGGVSLEKHEVVVLAPNADIVAQLEEMRPGRVIGNLAVPGVLRALVAIREARLPLRLWGCIADGAADRVLPLGPIEPAARPLAPDMVVASLASRATNGARVVTVGADTDALLSLRQALTRQGMSVSMTWDEKQASDMVEMVRPGIVVVDLSMQREACAFVAQLSRTNPIPTVVLIEGTSDTAASFAAALGDRAHASQMTSLKSYLVAMLNGR
jgi:ActR/RegA family two-component response regulator